MSESPIVSIIIPAYNSESYIERTLCSILEQTYHNFEVIIVIDGATDGTEIITRRFLKDNRVRLYIIKNSGPSHARNYGLDLARGKYIIFLDSDDHLVESYLEKMIKRIEETQSDICYCQYQYEKDGQVIQMSRTYIQPEGFIAQDYINRRVSIVTGSEAYRREFIINNGLRFEEGFSCQEDIVFRIKALCLGSATQISEPLLRLELRKDSFSRSISMKKFDDVVEIYRRLNIFIDSQIENEGLRNLYKYRINRFSIPKAISELLYVAWLSDQSMNAWMYVKAKGYDRYLRQFKPKKFRQWIGYLRNIIISYSKYMIEFHLP